MNWYWLVDGLVTISYSVHLFETAAIKQYLKTEEY